MIVSRGTLTTTYYGTHLEIADTTSVFFFRFLFIAFVVGGGMAICGWMVLLFCSHKIAGPLFRFEQSLDSIAKGDVKFRVTLRQKDQLENIEPHLNTLLETLDEKISQIKEDVKNVEEILADKESLAGEELNKLSEKVENIKKSSNFFRTSK